MINDEKIWISLYFKQGMIKIENKEMTTMLKKLKKKLLKQWNDMLRKKSIA